jgi:transcriptional regulator with XRE-family HTH domain
MLRVREFRLAKGYSVPQVSRETGMSVRTIQDIEKRGDCLVSNLVKLAKVLDVTLNDLWVDPPEEPEK